MHILFDNMSRKRKHFDENVVDNILEGKQSKGSNIVVRIQVQNGTVYDEVVDPSMTVWTLKESMSKRTGSKASEMQFSCNGRRMDDFLALADFDLKRCSFVEMSFRYE